MFVLSVVLSKAIYMFQLEYLRAPSLTEYPRTLNKSGVAVCSSIGHAIGGFFGGGGSNIQANTTVADIGTLQAQVIYQDAGRRTKIW